MFTCWLFYKTEMTFLKKNLKFLSVHLVPGPVLNVKLSNAIFFNPSRKSSTESVSFWSAFMS